MSSRASGVVAFRPLFHRLEDRRDTNFQLNATALDGETAMKFRMDKTLRFWVDCSYEDKRHKTANRTRAELTAEILREYERHGDAMRYLNVEGKIAWKASPAMLQKLTDAEREVQDDMEDWP
jgi:hypothetical protein